MKLLVCLALVGAALAMKDGDQHEMCCGWATMDECNTNSFWMKVNCQGSCGTMGCDTANAMSDDMGPNDACMSAVDIAGCPWSREFLEANWKQDGAAEVAADPVEEELLVPEEPVVEEEAPVVEEEAPVEEAPVEEVKEDPYGSVDVPPAPVADDEPILEEPIVEEEIVEEPVVEEEIVEEEPIVEEEIIEEPIVEEEIIEEPIVEEEIVEEPIVEEPVEEEIIEEPVVEEEIIEEAPEEPAQDAVVEEDKNPSCCGWAVYGECDNNAGWMKANCAFSCGPGLLDVETTCPEHLASKLAGLTLGAKEAEVQQEPAVEEAAPVEEPEVAPVEVEASGYRRFSRRFRNRRQ